MAKINVPRVAPAAVAVEPAVSMHGPPLNPGEVYEVPSHLTKFERDMLKKVNWKEGQPITQQMRDAAALMTQDAKTGAQTLSIDPATPAVNLNVKDINTLPHNEQNKVLQNINEVLAANIAANKARAGTPVTPSPFSVIQPRTAALPPVAEKVLGSKQIDVDLGEPERPATQASPELNWQREAPAIVETSPPNEKGMAPTHCKHCGWELIRDDIPAPSEEEKLAFLMCNTLGDGKPYVKIYSLMNGHLRVTFRMLTIREIDACYKQADVERQRGEVKNDFEWIEKVNRYRVCLQLKRLQSAQFDHEMPEGLSVLTNPHAEDCWKVNDVEPLKQIETTIMDTVLTTDSIWRIVTHNCNQFNRLVNKMEVNADNPDFWPAIGTPVSQ